MTKYMSESVLWNRFINPNTFKEPQSIRCFTSTFPRHHHHHSTNVGNLLRERKQFLYNITEIVNILQDLTKMEMKSLSDATYIVSQSGPKNRKTATCYTVAASVHPDPEDLLTHVGSKRRNTEVSSGISMKKCSICQKEFETTDALNTHLLMHQQKLQTCVVCHGVFKHDQLMSHMLTHQKKKTYCCTHSGCRKTYNNLNSLKNHCVMRHGVHNISASLGHPVSHLDDHAMSTQHSYTRDMSGLLISPPQMPKGPSNAQGKYPPQVKLSKKRRESWTLLTAGKSCEVTEREMFTSTHWASSRRPCDGVDTPLNVDDFERASELPESPSEDLLLIQPSKATATTSVRSTTSEDVCSSMPKHSLSKLKRHHSSSVVIHSPLLYPEPESDFGSDFPDHEIPPSPPGHVIRTSSPKPLPKNRKRIYSFKDSKEVLSDVPASFVPETRPKPSQEDSPHLVSLSQVALSFYSTSPGNPKKSTKKPRRKEQNSCNRTYTRSPAAPKTRSQSLYDSCGKMEENISQPCFSTQEEGQRGASGKKSKTKNLSPLIIPVSVPVLPTKASSSNSSPHPGQKLQSGKGLSKKSRHLPPLTISSPLPPSMSSPKCTTDHETQTSHRCGTTEGHPSQLRSPTSSAGQCASPRVCPPSYTPPPMLSPYRLGTAHYTLLQQYTAPSSVCKAIHNDVSLSIDNTVVTIKPRINVGSRFQAEIPPVRDTLYMLYEEHPAQLVWAPWKDLTTSKKTQRRVTDLLDLCCSSVLKGGGTNIELALHCLHEVQGNVSAALDLLLMREDFRTSRHPLNDYHYTGSDHWTDQEMRLFRKGLEDHGKDFHKIHLLLQTKSVAQCVEYYYIMKKLKKFKKCEQGADQKDGGETPVFQGSQESLPERSKGNPRKRNTKGSSIWKRCPCEETQLQLI
ncbi:uncharacterized protein znf541 isoform X2 [Misgurnus anguillicaudatus]|uniref:uncharacterized protein znf541 isoform X2 n=1 Tax=Misgurnus anguillicaudatus TaxID=75329 RepID=UPI003CCFD83F